MIFWGEKNTFFFFTKYASQYVPEEKMRRGNSFLLLMDKYELLYSCRKKVRAGKAVFLRKTIKSGW
jgi:hypothetical protein